MLFSLQAYIYARSAHKSKHKIQEFSEIDRAGPWFGSQWAKLLPNTYTGGTVVAGGILRTGNASALGSNQVVLLSATNVILDLNSTYLAVDSLSSGIVAPNIDNAGASYTSTPIVVVSGGGGSGATATATLTSGKVTAINIISRGANYRSAPTFTLSGGNPLTNAVLTGVYNPSSVTLGTGTLSISGPQSGLAVYGGNIAGTGNLIMNGSGMQVLTGSNTYSGATTMSNGALFVDGALFGTGGVVTVKGGALFGGTGQVQRVVTVENGGVLSAAATNTIGVLTLATNLNLKSGAVLDVELDGTGIGDQIVVQGTPNLNSDSGAGSLLRLTATGHLTGGQQFKIIDNQSALPVQGRFANDQALSLMTASGVVRLSVNYAGGADGNDVVVTVIGKGSAVFFR